MTLKLLLPEFPYLWGKFDFLFHQCGGPVESYILEFAGLNPNKSSFAFCTLKQV
jgi:hypothetical protein